jgi:DNA invertase Pin-like site-specific DNA recombinase
VRQYVRFFAIKTELDLLKERTQPGIERAKAAGKRLGRLPALSPQQRQEIALKAPPCASSPRNTVFREVLC